MKPVALQDIPKDVFTLLEKDWMLITAQKPDGTVNTMTAAWGGFGVMWNKPVAFVVIRPQRYTKEFVDATDRVSLSFFDGSYKETLTYLGRTSGRDVDKIAEAGLTLHREGEGPYFAEASLTIFGRKLFAQAMDETSFVDASIVDGVYPEKDFHTLYVYAIENIVTQ